MTCLWYETKVDLDGKDCGGRKRVKRKVLRRRTRWLGGRMFRMCAMRRAIEVKLYLGYRIIETGRLQNDVS